MKRILFILGTLDSGGVAKSLVNLLNVIDRDEYSIDLLLISKNHGPYYELLPTDINIIQNDLISNVGNLKGLPYLLRHRYYVLFVGTILRLFFAVFSKSISAYILSRLYPTIRGEWDLIVDYNGQQQLYYMVDKLKGKVKASFFHSDYSKWPYYFNTDKQYYPKVDAIFSISPKCVEVLKHYFPGQKDKIFLMENISSVKIIEKMSLAPIENTYTNKWIFLTVGHICKNKGTDLAIKAAQILKNNQVDFKWLFIGNIEKASEFSSLKKNCGVDANVLFLGTHANPYPYFKLANIIVHPSLFEGKSVTLDEAKLFCKPIVVTNFSTVNDQFENGVTAEIVNMTPEDIANGIMELIQNQDKRNLFAANLRRCRHDNSDEIVKIYNLLQ